MGGRSVPGVDHFGRGVNRVAVFNQAAMKNVPKGRIIFNHKHSHRAIVAAQHEADVKTAFISGSCTISYGRPMRNFLRRNRAQTTTMSQPEATENHPETISRILQRVQFAARPGEVERFAGWSAEDVVAHLIGNDQPFIWDDSEVADHVQSLGDGPWDALNRWYTQRITSRTAGLHERMVWFWHGHFTSSTDKVNSAAIVGQHHLVRTHALGNFRDFLREITTDAAMLEWLDGAGSRGDEPNENYAREMMELFALGPGTHTEEDIRVAARILAGWNVDYQTLDVTFDPEEAYDRPLRFMGQRKRWNVDSLVDHICALPACANFVAGRVYRYFVGAEPSPAERVALGRVFREADLEILPLVEAILNQPAFLNAEITRPRTPVEWLAGAAAVFGEDAFANEMLEYEPWWLPDMQQEPFAPPNVGGWPEDNRWLGAGQVLRRADIVLSAELSRDLIDLLEPEIDAVAAHCGVYALSDQTRAALVTAIEAQTEFDGGLELLLALVLTSPEFSLQ